MSFEAAADVGVGSWIERRARIDPDRPALISGDRPVTYAELAERIRRLAAGLDRLGVVRGDRVAWVGPNHVAFLEAFFAVGRLGAVVAPVNHRLPPNDRALVLEDAEPRALIEHHAVPPTRAPASVHHRLIAAEARREVRSTTRRSSPGRPIAWSTQGSTSTTCCSCPTRRAPRGRPKG